MTTMMRCLGLVVVMSATATARGNQRVLAHYRLGEGLGITYAVGPELLKDLSGNGRHLARSGEPKFFASNPANRADGALRFDGQSSWYQTDQAVGEARGSFWLEAWAKAEQADDPGLHGVVSNGDGAQGYTIAQQGARWVAFVGGVGAFPMGVVDAGTWVHLALVADGERLHLYRDGKRTGEFQRAAGLQPNLSIGDMGRGEEVFLGDIHEVRLCAIDPGAFDPDADLLLDYAKLKRHREVERARQVALVDALAKPSTGVRLVDSLEMDPVHADWLVTPVTRPVELLVLPSHHGRTARLVLQNGLVSRVFYVSDNLACVSYRLHANDAQFLRAVKPEARVQLDGTWYEVGGLKGQPEKSYLLDEWLPDMTGDPRAFRFKGMETREPEARYPWRPKYNAAQTPWPPKGLRVDFHFEAPETADDQHRGTRVTVHYELYEGLPVLAKWFTLQNATGSDIRIDRFEGEVLAVAQDQVRRLHMESDYAFALSHVHPEGSALLHFQGTPKAWQAGRGTTKWRLDPDYDTWATQNPTEEVFSGRDFRCLAVSTPPMGPGATVEPGNTFRSFTTFELLNDSDDRERRTLGHRRLYATLAPQVTEDLLCFGISAYEFHRLKPVIDQMAELGFESLNLMAWPGINHANLEPAYVANLRKVVDYAAARGVVVGGYELWIASRGRGDDVNCIHPDTGTPGSLFGQSVCVASSWWDGYTDKMWTFFDRTGIAMTLFDGPYHGDPCASTRHPHHRGLEDSQWRQWQLQVEAIHEFQRRGFYVPLPDWYFLNGQAATGMGYREASANLSPQQQLLLGRQYIYDGTWHKIPSMGWMGLQLVGFYTSDARVGLEPLSENIDRYERGLMQYLGSGCQFTLRGNRIYDSPEVKAMVKKWMDWRRTYRAILTSDIIHLGRPTGRDLDCMLHVNARLDTKGLAIVFNPTNRRIRKDLVLPLYYTGLTDTARVSEQGGPARTCTLDRAYSISVPVEIDPNGFTWLVIE